MNVINRIVNAICNLFGSKGRFAMPKELNTRVKMPKEAKLLLDKYYTAHPHLRPAGVLSCRIFDVTPVGLQAYDEYVKRLTAKPTGRTLEFFGLDVETMPRGSLDHMVQLTRRDYFSLYNACHESAKVVVMRFRNHDGSVTTIFGATKNGTSAGYCGVLQPSIDPPANSDFSAV